MRRWGIGMKKKKDKVDHHSPEEQRRVVEEPKPKEQSEPKQKTKPDATTVATAVPPATTSSSYYLWHIQIQSEAKWELLPNIMACISSLQLHVLDHRTWNAPPSPYSPTNETIVFNEIYCKDKTSNPTNVHEFEERRIEQITLALQLAIHQEPHPMTRVNVQRWVPPQKEEEEEERDNNKESRGNPSVTPTTVTTVYQATKEDEEVEVVDANETNDSVQELLKPTSQRRLRRKMKSTPAGFLGTNGVDMFGVATSSSKSEGNYNPKQRRGCYHKATIVLKSSEDGNSDTHTNGSSCFDVLLSDEVVDALTSGFRRSMEFKSRSMLSTMIQPDFDSTHDDNVVGNQLHGYIRNRKIQKEEEEESNTTKDEDDNITETTDRSSV